MAAPSILPFDGARYMFVGSSFTNHHRWPAYFAAYFSLRYPQYTLHYAMDARGGTSISRMFGNNEFGWTTEAPISNYHVHYRTVQPWGADFVFIQHAESGGFGPEVDADHRESYINNYCVPDGITPIIINGWQAAAPPPVSNAAQDEETAIHARALANDWNSATIFDVTRAKWGTEYAYTANAATDIFTVPGHPFTNGMRVRIHDKNGDNPEPLVMTVGNLRKDYWVRDVSGDTFKLADTENGPAIDLTTDSSSTSIINPGPAISRKWALMNGADAGHVGAPAYMAQWKYMMDSLGLDTSVSQATINAGTATVTSQTQCTISGVAANAYHGVDFNRLDNRLPYVLDDDWWPDAVELEPDLLTHQDYSMKVTGLGTGTFDIFCNNVLLGSATGAELANGWNMAALQVGPVFDKGKEVLGRIRDAQGRVRAYDGQEADLPTTDPASGFGAYRQAAATSYDVNGNRGATHVTALSAQRALLDTLDAAIKTAAQPETLAFSIRATRAWNYAGIPYPLDWPYDPFLIAAPTRPAEWPAATKVGMYFVQPGHGSATDTWDSIEPRDTNNLRWGYPNKPRLTIPQSSASGTDYVAGCVIWIKGGTFNASYGGQHAWQGDFMGTGSLPIWIYGDPDDKPVFQELRIQLGLNDAYVMVENITWGEWTTGSSSCVTVANQGHHVCVRNCVVEKRAYDGNVAFFSLDGGAAIGQDTHDFVLYKIIYRDNSWGTTWGADEDSDQHGFKPDGPWGGGRAKRAWVIECTGTYTGNDPGQGIPKSLGGSFVQVGDQNTTTGNVDHIYVGGNVCNHQRGSFVGCKRSADVIASGNRADEQKTHAPGGTMMNTKYDRQEYHWFINNWCEKQGPLLRRNELTAGGSGGPDTETPDESYVFAIGNISKDCAANETSSTIGGWKYNGMALHDCRGHFYAVNNVMDDTLYGLVTAQNSRYDADGEIHLYNNIFVNQTATIDPNGGVGISITSGPVKLFIENNLQDDLKFYFHTTGGMYSTAATLNARADSNGNIEAAPLFTDSANDDYSLQAGSPAIGAGVYEPTIAGAMNVYQMFIDRYTDDPDFPEDPAAVWPRDYAMNSRLVGGAIDIGAYAYGSAVPTIPEPDPAPSNNTPPSISGTPVQGTQVTSSPGSWSGAVSYAYQWTRTTGSVVVGTSINYTPVLADVGSTLTFRVTATNATGPTSLTTAASAAVIATNAPPAQPTFSVSRHITPSSP